MAIVKELEYLAIFAETATELYEEQGRVHGQTLEPYNAIVQSGARPNINIVYIFVVQKPYLSSPVQSTMCVPCCFGDRKLRSY